jgi:hypothetical protein
MDFGRLQRGEFIGFAGVGVLLISLWLPWFSTGDSKNGRINGETGDFTAWDTYGTLDWLLVAACAAPPILAWIVVRGHKLTWRPGEITMIVGMTAFALIILNGIILGRPGEPDSEIEIRYGYWVGLFGAALICAGGVIRQAEGDRARKPPGTI